MTYDFIHSDRHGAVARICIDRPDARNAQSLQLLDELDDAFRAAERDPEVRVIVLAAAGAHFSAGHDLKEGAARSAKVGELSVESRWEMEEEKYFNYCLRIWDCPKPTIAEVRGACISAGFMVANMCDLVIASDTAYFADPVVHSLSAASVEVLVHPWVMGLRQAKFMLFTGARVGADEALRIGLVNQVVTDTELNATTMQLAQRVAQAQPFALRLTKRSLNRSLDVQGFRTALNAHFDTHQLSHKTDEFNTVRKRGLDQALHKS